MVYYPKKLKLGLVPAVRRYALQTIKTNWKSLINERKNDLIKSVNSKNDNEKVNSSKQNVSTQEMTLVKWEKDHKIKKYKRELKKVNEFKKTLTSDKLVIVDSIQHDKTINDIDLLREILDDYVLYDGQLFNEHAKLAVDSYLVRKKKELVDNQLIKIKNSDTFVLTDVFLKYM